MSRFYGEVVGNRGPATRGGSKDSGIRGHIRGWSSGGEVRCYVNDKDQDVVDIYITSGSNGRHSDQLICTTVAGKITYLASTENIQGYMFGKDA